MNKTPLISLVLLMLFAYSESTIAKTDRISTVHIMNLTGGPIVAGYSHKYSNDFENSGTTGEEKALINFGIQAVGKAKYRTGFGTTGRDWWIVSYVDDKGCEYISSPKNARKFIDGLEKAAIYTGGILIEVGIDVAIAGLLDPEPVGKIAGGVVGIIAGGLGATMIGLSNSESTADFKQHILRSEDSSIVISITKDEVTFSSDSGTSKTGMSFTGKCLMKK